MKYGKQKKKLHSNILDLTNNFFFIQTNLIYINDYEKPMIQAQTIKFKIPKKRQQEIMEFKRKNWLETVGYH
ncbi:unnamed protein product [Paramecium sonneborni]|uniref:Uncharacterized protein n=1 Tax=Paramecium sonneborni TaxID=65129 RepID=A0A8S1RQL1_9CILI|nr:unnamed protein product [Paramecium sonneborni]